MQSNQPRTDDSIFCSLQISVPFWAWDNKNLEQKKEHLRQLLEPYIDLSVYETKETDEGKANEGPVECISDAEEVEG